MLDRNRSNTCTISGKKRIVMSEMISPKIRLRPETSARA